MLLRNALGETLREARTQQNRTLRDVSTAANVSLGYLSEVERGRKEASSELLASICDALDLQLAEVLDTVSRTIRTDMAAASVKTANSTKLGLDPSRRLDPALRIVMPYGGNRPSTPVG
jgi:transcriptional regulator with XRE-family HTH domain